MNKVLIVGPTVIISSEKVLLSLLLSQSGSEGGLSNGTVVCYSGALDGGSQMSHVDFKKCPSLLSLFLQGFMSDVQKYFMPCPLFSLSCHLALCPMLILRNGHVAASDLSIKSPTHSWNHL